MFAGTNGKAPLFRGNIVVGIGFTLAAGVKDLGISDEGPVK